MQRAHSNKIKKYLLKFTQFLIHLTQYWVKFMQRKVIYMKLLRKGENRRMESSEGKRVEIRKERGMGKKG